MRMEKHPVRTRPGHSRPGPGQKQIKYNGHSLLSEQRLYLPTHRPPSNSPPAPPNTPVAPHNRQNRLQTAPRTRLCTKNRPASRSQPRQIDPHPTFAANLSKTLVNSNEHSSNTHYHPPIPKTPENRQIQIQTDLPLATAFPPLHFPSLPPHAPPYATLSSPMSPLRSSPKLGFARPLNSFDTAMTPCYDTRGLVIRFCVGSTQNQRTSDGSSRRRHPT